MGKCSFLLKLGRSLFLFIVFITLLSAVSAQLQLLCELNSYELIFIGVGAEQPGVIEINFVVKR